MQLAMEASIDNMAGERRAERCETAHLLGPRIERLDQFPLGRLQTIGNKNFGIIFGMSVATLAAELGVDEETAAEYLRIWEEQAPAGAKWREERPYLYLAERGLCTARRWIDYLDDAEAEISKSTRPKNYPVQGGAADVMHRAMRLLFERYRSWPGRAKPVLTIHDEILVEADADAADQVGALLADVMVEAFRDVLPNGPTRFLAIPGAGPTWAAAKADGEKREKALRSSVAAV
jgi:DNA polymerase-1